jgi:hypothetical protein
MHFYSFVHIALSFFTGLPGGDAAGQIRTVGREIAVCFFDNDQEAIYSYLSPSFGFLICACLRMLLSVPGARSWGVDNA